MQRIRKAFENRSIEASKQAHQLPIVLEGTGAETIEAYLADMVYASLDGIVTTFAIVSGVAGANLPARIILILGAANLLADGFSMAVGNFLSIKAKARYEEKERKREEWEVKHLPEEERKEIEKIFQAKGLEGKDLKEITEIVTRYPKLWVDFMMSEELNLIEEKIPAILHASATFIAFFLAGCIPLFIPVLNLFYPLERNYTIFFTIIFTIAALFIVGILRARITLEKWWESALQMVALGGLAAAAAYAAGWLLSQLV